jgi:hypothetical protein
MDPVLMGPTAQVSREVAAQCPPHHSQYESKGDTERLLVNRTSPVGRHDADDAAVLCLQRVAQLGGLDDLCWRHDRAPLVVPTGPPYAGVRPPPTFLYVMCRSAWAVSLHFLLKVQVHLPRLQHVVCRHFTGVVSYSPHHALSYHTSVAQCLREHHATHTRMVYASFRHVDLGNAVMVAYIRGSSHSLMLLPPPE